MDNEKKLASIFQQKKTAPFLFIGSGFTRHYLNSPTWLQILEKFAPRHINSYISSIFVFGFIEMPTLQLFCFIYFIISYTSSLFLQASK